MSTPFSEIICRIVDTKIQLHECAGSNEVLESRLKHYCAELDSYVLLLTSVRNAATPPNGSLLLNEVWTEAKFHKLIEDKTETRKV